mmetsp:Transcript_62150/g.143109  ORF Transcript_62150/g.143109 Transcript_62150/m.143109 type:complete len:367 (-) Transcript_62150:64-1164(-)
MRVALLVVAAAAAASCTEVAQMKTKELKALLKEHGSSCKGCTQKAEYMARAAEVLKCGGESSEPRTVYSIGDLHGDLDHFATILQKTGLATVDGTNATWTGGRSILVSTGDSVDRGEFGRSIYLIFKALAEQAPLHGGEVVNIVGNHELMNLQGDLRYVHEMEMHPDGEYGGQAQREKDWSRSGVVGADIRQRYYAAAVREGTVFVHGGLTPEILSQTKELDTNRPPLDNLNQKCRELFDNDRVPFNVRSPPVFGATGPFWNRFFAEEPERQVCPSVEKTLSIVGAKRMVLGHTPQTEGVSTRCPTATGPRIILADTVISRAYEASFGFSRMSAVEYSGDTVTALYFPPGQEAPVRKVLFEPKQEL